MISQIGNLWMDNIVRSVSCTCIYINTAILNLIKQAPQPHPTTGEFVSHPLGGDLNISLSRGGNNFITQRQCDSLGAAGNAQLGKDITDM